jgi:hypothetical protein
MYDVKEEVTKTIMTTGNSIIIIILIIYYYYLLFLFSSTGILLLRIKRFDDRSHLASPPAASGPSSQHNPTIPTDT